MITLAVGAATPLFLGSEAARMVTYFHRSCKLLKMLYFSRTLCTCSGSSVIV